MPILLQLAGHPWVLCVVIVVFAAAFLAGGCSDMKRPNIAPSPDIAVVVIPGYYGTRLVEVPSGRLVWLSLHEALLGTSSLAVPLPGLGINNTFHVAPDGILYDIPIIPFVYSVNAYGTLVAP